MLSMFRYVINIYNIPFGVLQSHQTKQSFKSEKKILNTNPQLFL